MSEFRGEMKSLVQTYVELLYPDDSDMQAALFENITSGKKSVSLEEMQDYVATRSSWYAEIEAVNPSMAVVHNQNDEFVGTVEVMDDSDDPEIVEVFVNDDQMNEISSTNLYEDGQFWEDYDAETFNADTVLNQESFDKLMGQLDRMTMNELYMIKHQAQLRLRDLGMGAEYMAETFNAMSFKQWSEDEMNEELHGGQDMDFDSWLNDEIHTHGNIPLKEWGYEEEHDEPEHQHAESMMSKQGKVRTLSGKPHKARRMMKDKNITPEEAKTRLSFRARKGIDTYAEPIEEIGSFYSGKKGMLKIVGLGALVTAGVWITKNKLLE